ncbi:protein DGCR6-like [Tubulanus polymorphus]|uniref:protein DGCR6-like n=1 Tax=Tubulanus polymorphus TaxID=672921 RepID=UPI003DA41ADA
MDSTSFKTPTSPQKRELMQKRHYFMLSELQNMARDLPSKYQQRLPYDLLTGLASSLLDDTIVGIVGNMREVQQLEERHLFNSRAKMINEYKVNKEELKKKYKEDKIQSQSKPHNLPLIEQRFQKDIEVLKQRHEEELKRRDMKIILELDQKVMDQQSILEKAGVPGFYVTNNPQDLRLQMYLLDFITRISNMEIPT